jgi:hypothetical protein
MSAECFHDSIWMHRSANRWNGAGRYTWSAILSCRSEIFFLFKLRFHSGARFGLG